MEFSATEIFHLKLGVNKYGKNFERIKKEYHFSKEKTISDLEKKWEKMTSSKLDKRPFKTISIDNKKNKSFILSSSSLQKKEENLYQQQKQLISILSSYNNKREKLIYFDILNDENDFNSFYDDDDILLLKKNQQTTNEIEDDEQTIMNTPSAVYPKPWFSGEKRKQAHSLLVNSICKEMEKTKMNSSCTTYSTTSSEEEESDSDDEKEFVNLKNEMIRMKLIDQFNLLLLNHQVTDKLIWKLIRFAIPLKIREFFTFFFHFFSYSTFSIVNDDDGATIVSEEIEENSKVWKLLFNEIKSCEKEEELSKILPLFQCVIQYATCNNSGFIQSFQNDFNNEFSQLISIIWGKWEIYSKENDGNARQLCDGFIRLTRKLMLSTTNFQVALLPENIRDRIHDVN